LCGGGVCPPGTNPCFSQLPRPEWCEPDNVIPGCCCRSAEGRSVGTIGAGSQCSGGGDFSLGTSCSSQCQDSVCPESQFPPCDWDPRETGCENAEPGGWVYLLCNWCEVHPWGCQTLCERQGIFCPTQPIGEIGRGEREEDEEPNPFDEFLPEVIVISIEADNNNEWWM